MNWKNIVMGIVMGAAAIFGISTGGMYFYQCHMDACHRTEISNLSGQNEQLKNDLNRVCRDNNQLQQENRKLQGEIGQTDVTSIRATTRYEERQILYGQAGSYIDGDVVVKYISQYPSWISCDVTWPDRETSFWGAWPGDNCSRTITAKGTYECILLSIGDTAATIGVRKVQ